MKLGWIAFLAPVLVCLPAWAQADSESLAKAAQNPVAKMISVPFQNNMGFNYGTGSDVQNVFNIQPVVPIDLSCEWNLITRTIIPLVSQPGLTGG